MTQTKKTKGPYTAKQAGSRVGARLRIVGAVSKAIRKREKKNPELTRTAVALKLGVSRQRVSLILNNAGNWTLDTIGDLLSAYDLEIQDIKVALSEDLTARNYANPLSQASRGTYDARIVPSSTKVYTAAPDRAANESSWRNMTSMRTPKARVTFETTVAL